MNTTMKYRTCCQVAACLAAWLISCVSVCQADAEEVQQFPFRETPAYSNWPTTWSSLGSKLYDPIESSPDIADHLDFVGDATNPGAYWAQDNNYIYFRVRVDVGTVVTDLTNPDDNGNTFGDTVHVLVDQYGVGGANLPDFGFSWDSKEAYAKHGLEMTKYLSSDTTWGTVKMTDVDGLQADKGTADFNGNGRTTDGYIRTIDGQSTSNFSTTTFIDFAISWTYLTQYSKTGLASGQTWRIALGSIANANDHNFIDTDIAGASPSTSISDPGDYGWSDPITTQQVPEPSSLVVLSVVALTSYMGVRFRRRKDTAVENTSN
jgi:hypothetical protein